MPEPKLTVYEMAKIQMEMVVPLLRDLQQILGEDVIMEALQQRAEMKVAAAEKASRGPVRVTDSKILQDFEHYAEGGILDYETRIVNADRIEVDVTRCGFTELMKTLNATDLGPYLMCADDHAAAAFAGNTLTRTQTCMQGANHCDFCFTSGRAD